MTDSQAQNSPAESYDQVVDEFSFLIRDKNHDGVLTEEEFDEGRSVFDKLADPERFERYDLDGDGTVSREEFLRGRETDRDIEAHESAANTPTGPNDIPLPPPRREG